MSRFCGLFLLWCFVSLLFPKPNNMLSSEMWRRVFQKVHNAGFLLKQKRRDDLHPMWIHCWESKALQYHTKCIQIRLLKRACGVPLEKLKEFNVSNYRFSLGDGSMIDTDKTWNRAVNGLLPRTQPLVKKNIEKLKYVLPALLSAGHINSSPTCNILQRCSRIHFRGLALRSETELGWTKQIMIECVKNLAQHGLQVPMFVQPQHFHFHFTGDVWRLLEQHVSEELLVALLKTQMVRESYYLEENGYAYLCRHSSEEVSRCARQVVEKHRLSRFFRPACHKYTRTHMMKSQNGDDHK